MHSVELVGMARWMAAGVASLALAGTLHAAEPEAPAAESAPAPAPADAPAAPVVKEESSFPSAQIDPAWGRLTLGASAGDDLQVYQAEVLLPLLTSDRRSLFLNPRFLLLESEAQEANLGLVLRGLCPHNAVIMGINAFYDARFTEADNTLQQVGGGVEMLSRWVDARANYYWPLSDEKLLDSYEEVGVTVSGGRRITTTTLFRSTEEAMEGFDAEVGVWLPYLARHLPTALFVGYYNFDPQVEADRVDGFKVRLEARPCPNITLDAEWFDETAYRDSEYVVGVRLHLPLDFWNGMCIRRGGKRVPDFASRMTDPVQRDFRVRTFVSPFLSASRRQSETRLADKPRRSKAPERVCTSYPALDENGEVIMVTVCE